MESKERKGIIDFEDKLELLKSLLSVDTQKKLADQLLLKKFPAGEKRHDIWRDRFLESFKGYKPPRSVEPVGETGALFLDVVEGYLKEIGCQNETNLRHIFYKGSIDDLSDCLPPERLPERWRKRLTRDTNQLIVKTDKELMNSYSIKEDLSKGLIDHRWCYLHPEAPQIWDTITHSGTYQQYAYCLDALESFLTHEQWQAFCRDRAPDGAVSLGAGSASKDIQIIKSLQVLVPLDKQPALTLSLVDYSPYMLNYTAKKVINTAEKLSKKSRPIHVHALNKDFTRLQPWQELRRREAPVAWFINGGTIGNINNEAELLHSVATQAELGDWLMVSMDTIPEEENTYEGLKQLAQKLEKQYRQPYTMELLRPSLLAVWFYLGYSKPFDIALAEVDVNAVPAKVGIHTAVPGSLSVEFKAKGKNNSVVLLASTRYVEQNFTDFAASHGFKHIVSVPTPKSASYKILAFEYEDSG